MHLSINPPHIFANKKHFDQITDCIKMRNHQAKKVPRGKDAGSMHSKNVEMISTIQIQKLKRSNPTMSAFNTNNNNNKKTS